MTNLNDLKELRTKEEIEDCFKQLGKNITEEELNALKQSYDKAQESSDALTMQQLDDVAGGVGTICAWNGSPYFKSNTMKIGIGHGDRICGQDWTNTGFSITFSNLSSSFFRINTKEDSIGQVFSLTKLDTKRLNEETYIAGDRETMVLISKPRVDKNGQLLKSQILGNVTGIVVPDEMLEKIHGLPEKLSLLESGKLVDGSTFSLD